MVDSSTVDIAGVGPVLFRRSKRARRVTISIKPFSGVRVSVPHGLSFSKAEDFVVTKTGWIQRQLVRMKHIEQEYETISNSLPDIDKKQAGTRLISRLNELADKFGYTYKRVFIRNQRTRWGSCSPGNNISLNVNLVRLPDELIDYVILHELVHTRIKNHSGDFWAHLDGLMNNAKVFNARLKKYK